LTVDHYKYYRLIFLLFQVETLHSFYKLSRTQSKHKKTEKQKAIVLQTMPLKRSQTPIASPSQQLEQENRDVPLASSSIVQQFRGPGARGIGAGVGSTSQKYLGTSLLHRRQPISGGKTRNGGSAPSGLGKGLAMRRRHRKVCLMQSFVSHSLLREGLYCSSFSFSPLDYI